MQVMYPRCAALDLGKDVLAAAVRVQGDGSVTQECRSYRTTTQSLVELCAWLHSHGVTHVVMEATGSYWKAVWRMLEGRFELMLANPVQVKNLPGRKSDVNDATWMADLLAHGLIRGSFVPATQIGALRELTRTRKQLVRELARHTLRIQKILDVANLKLTGTISQILGVTGRAILKALIAGETDPQRLADLAHPRVQVSRERLVESLHGRLTEQQRRLLELHLTLIDTLQASIDQLDREIAKAVSPFRQDLERLKTTPGLSDIVVPAMLGEIGLDMTRFRTHRHLVSWARLCPRLDESAGKIHSTRTLKGAAWIKTIMIQAAWCAVRVKNSYPRAQFLRIRSRRGTKKAIVAVAASLLTAVYYMLRDGTEYRDLGTDHFDKQDRSKVARRFVARLTQLGYHVQISEAAA
jgi:transposase